MVCDKPATRVYDWADLLAIVCSSARVGEYIESTCRAGSGRGLYYRVSITEYPHCRVIVQADEEIPQNVTFGVFLNEHGNAEFAVQLVRDAKGMTDNPAKR